MSELHEAQRTAGTSLAFIYPTYVRSVTEKERDEDDAAAFHNKQQKLLKQNEAQRSQRALFESMTPPEMKSLDYLGSRVSVDWLCSDAECSGHKTQILDWEICELARNHGMPTAIEKVNRLLSEEHRTAFMLGNFRLFPGSFAIIGLWYPKRTLQASLGLNFS